LAFQLLLLIWNISGLQMVHSPVYGFFTVDIPLRWVQQVIMVRSIDAEQGYATHVAFCNLNVRRVF
jgi:hypothetical protein